MLSRKQSNLLQQKLDNQQ